LQIPAGPAGRYRLAQLDDYTHLKRRDFPWYPPFTLTVRARASHTTFRGTWGFGLWNDPFGFSLGFGAGQRLPTLPNAAWFFFASPPNYLSLRDDLPAQGNLAATFRSPRWPSIWLTLAMPLIPLYLLPPAARLLRRLGAHFIHQEAVQLPLDPTQWHEYSLEWQSNEVTFYVDGSQVLLTPISPQPPLGKVIWIDNQYAAFPPRGRPAFGTLPTHEPAWIEVEDTSLTSG